MQYGYRDLFLLLKISAIYLTLKYLCLRKQIVTLHLTSGILYAGSLTYGVYLFHVIFMRKILFTKNLILLFNKYAPFLAVLLYCLLIMIVSACLTAILKKYHGCVTIYSVTIYSVIIDRA